MTWYARLLDQLAPTEDEIAAREATYRGLLAARSKAGVTIGQQGLLRLADAGRVDVGALLDASSPALLFKQKSVATAQLKLIGKAAGLRPASAGDAAAAGAVAFGHERQDIQEAALALITKLGVPAGEPLAEIRRRAADLSPSLIPQAIALGLLDAPPPPLLPPPLPPPSPPVPTRPPTTRSPAHRYRARPPSKRGWPRCRLPPPRISPGRSR